MGCGKSSVGRELAGLLSLPFIDLDGYIETCEGRSVREIFSVVGETEFRALELKALKEILFQGKSPEAADRREHDGSEYSAKEDYPRSGNLVLALGGGTLTTPECAALVAEHTFCIHLTASADTLFARLEKESADRPMLNQLAQTDGTLSEAHNGAGCPANPSEPPAQRLLLRISELLRQREPLYEKTARRTIATDGLSISQIAAAISKLPNESVTNHRTESPQITE